MWIEARVRRVLDLATGAADRGAGDRRAMSASGSPPRPALRQSVEQIAAAELRFRTAFEAAPIGMALSDLEGRFIQVNDALCAITGYTREELEEIGFSDLSHPSDTQSRRRDDV